MRIKIIAATIIAMVMAAGGAAAADRWIADAFTTASIGANSSLVIDRPIPWNSADIGKITVYPSTVTGTTTFGIYRRGTCLDADMAYKSQAFGGNLIDPVQRVSGTQFERNANVIANYDDLDAGKEIHVKITNTSAVSKTYQVSISYARAVVSETIDVKDFGAKGDGATDDTTAIHNAVAALTAAGGGTLLFPEGTYRVIYPGASAAYPHAVFMLPSNTKVIGRGATVYHDYESDISCDYPHVFAIWGAVHDISIEGLAF
jgi:hypothetical protein